MKTVTRMLTASLALGIMLLGPPAGADDAPPEDEVVCRLIRGAATPEDLTDDVEVCRQDNWVHAGDSRLGNLAGVNQGAVPGWNTTEPSGSLEEAGAGYASVRVAEIAFPRDRKFTPTIAGTYTGVLDNLAMTIYLSCPLYQATGTPYPASLLLTVDGAAIVDRTALDSQVDTPIIADTDQYGHIQLAFTNLHEALEAYDIENSADTEHTIEFSILSPFWGDGHAVVLYDAAEVPTGATFNIEPTNLGGFTSVDSLEG